MPGFNIHNRSIKFLVPVILAVTFNACQPPEEKTVEFPDNILNEAALTKLLTSFALAESAANMNIKSVPAYKMDTVYAFNPLIENGVRQSQYDSTLNFYTRHPQLYKKVYENVLAELTLMQTRRDSLKAVQGPK